MVPKLMSLDRDVVMGHEFCAEVIELGENVGNSRVGDIVVSMPIVFDPSGIHPIGYSNEYPGGYAEQLMLADLLTLKVPNGLDPRIAALTEPMAVGLHAVERSRVEPGMVRRGAGMRSGRAGGHRRAAPRRGRDDRRRGLLAPATRAGRDDGRDRGGRSPGRAGRAGVAARRRAAADGDLRGGRRQRHARRRDPRRATQRPGRRRRRVHAARHDPADGRGRQGAQPAVRAGLRPDGVRRRRCGASPRASSTSHR